MTTIAASKNVMPSDGEIRLNGIAGRREELVLSQLTTVDGLIAFFGERMRETHAALRSMLQGQDGRTKVMKGLTDMQAILGNLKEGEKLGPGHPKWDEFMKVYNDVKGLLPEFDRGRVDQLLDGAVQRQRPYKTPDNEGWDKEADARALAAQCTGQVTVVEVAGEWYVCAEEGPAAGIDQSQAKEISLKLKALGDTLGQENQAEAIRVQEYVARIGQLTSLCSNIVAKFDEARMAPINNLRG